MTDKPTHAEGLAPEGSPAWQKAETRKRPIKVFVHLAHGFDAVTWRKRHASGELLGINDPTPYGYERANEGDLQISFSQDAPENALQRFCRLAARTVLGFDYVHVHRNAQGIGAADIVWTHTESQYLAVALLLSRLRRQSPRPKLLAQSVWLFDRWRRFSSLRRRFYSRLIQEADVLTVHSPDNLALARSLFPEKRAELVLFGIPAETKVEPGPRRSPGAPLKVLGLGNDFDRDWETAIAALRGRSDVELTILSARAPKRLAGGNIRITTVSTNDALRAAFAEADVLIVPLKPNLHASGITVMQEGALNGVPIVATDTGGLRAYFGDEAVLYVPAGDREALLQGVLSVASDPEGALARARVAQARMGSGGLGCDAFIARHVELTHALVE